MAATPAPSLNDRYRQYLLRYDRGAVSRKRAYQFVWLSVAILTWLTLLVAILGTEFEYMPWFERPIVDHAISGFGGIVVVLIVAQTTLGLQGRWLAYRAAAERLRRACMAYRAGLPPFDRPDATAELDRTMADIAAIADTQRGRPFYERFSWTYIWDLLRIPPDVRRLFPSTPDEGLALGPIAKDGEILDGRLRNQRRWYVRKSRRYFRLYLLFQLAIISCSVANVLHVLLLHRVFWVVAVTTTLSLGLIALRDFLDFGPLFIRYLQTAGNLKEIEDAYLTRKPPFEQADETERRRRLVEQVEQTLSSEFQYWYVTRR
jgi:hypothetical protein